MNSRITKYIFAWLPVAAWMLFIYFLSSFHKLSVSDVSWQDFITRKLAHITEYAILSGLIYRALGGTFTRLVTSHQLLITIALSVLYALTDEYHQTLVSGRTGRWFDIGIDSLGVIIGVLTLRFNIINKIQMSFRAKLSSKFKVKN